MCTALVILSLLAGADEDLAAVAAVHGAPGPWAVAGYRMAKHAQRELQAGEWDLEVEHQSPKQVQYSCIADGVQAATKVSVGKLSLKWTEATETSTTYTNKKTGKSLTLRPADAFVKRFKDAPQAKAKENGRAVLALKDDEIFTVAK